jgi:hypothetical protein
MQVINSTNTTMCKQTNYFSLYFIKYQKLFQVKVTYIFKRTYFLTNQVNVNIISVYGRS